MTELDLIKEFDKLMSHLNGEENSMAEEFREYLMSAVYVIQTRFGGPIDMAALHMVHKSTGYYDKDKEHD